MKMTMFAEAAKSWNGMNRYLRAFYTAVFVFAIGMSAFELIRFSGEMDDVIYIFAFPMCVITGLAVAFILRKTSVRDSKDSGRPSTPHPDGSERT